MLKQLVWIELLASISLLLLSIWPISGLCSGRPAGFDCESWFIFGVNAFGPLGILLLLCSIWSSKTGLWLPQLILLLGSLLVASYWALHMFF
jgi:hypothetical protein